MVPRRDPEFWDNVEIDLVYPENNESEDRGSHCILGYTKDIQKEQEEQAAEREKQ